MQVLHSLYVYRLYTKIFTSQFVIEYMDYWSRDSGYGLEGRGVGVRVPLQERFSCSPRSHVGPTQISTECVPELLTPRVEWPMREVDQSPHTSTTPHVFI
jgi:hypothetical protein